MNYLEKSKEELIAEILDLQQQNSFLKTSMDSEIIKRIEVEERYCLNELKLNDIFEQPLLGISITSVDGSLKTNDAFCQILGYSSDELSKLKWQAITHPEDIALSQQFVDLLFSGEKDFARWEKRYIHKNGQIIWVDIASSVRMDQNKKPLYFVTTIQNISERRQSTIDIFDSQEKLRKLLENMPVPICLVDANGVINYRNERFIKLIGYTQAEVPSINEWWLNAYPDENYRKEAQEDWIYASGKSMETGQDIVPGEYRVTCKDGQVRDLIISGLTINDILLVTFFDFTEHKQTELALRKNEEQYRLISSVVSDYIFTSKLDDFNNLSLIWVTGAFERITGYRFEEYLAAGGWRARLHPDDLEKDNRDFDELSKNNQVISDVRTYAKNGKLVWVRVYAHPVWDYQNNRITGIYGGVKDITESKLAEKSLIESELRFRETLENIHLISIQINNAGELIYCNPYLCQITGYSREEIIGKDWFTTFVPDVHTDAKVMFMTGLKQGKIESLYENPIRTKNGSERMIRFSNTILRNPEGQVIGTTSIGEDITERKLAEEKLFESEERFRKIFEEGPMGMAMASLQTGKPINANKAFCNMLGYTLEELQQLSFLDFTHPDDRGNDIVGFKKLIEGKLEKYTTEKRYLKKNSDVIWGTLALTKIYNEADQTYYALAMIEDINVRKLAETALREEKDRIRTILDLVGDPIFVKDNEHRITLANQAFYDMFGMDEESVIGQTLVEEVSENERHHFLKVDRSVLDTGIPDIREEELTVGDMKRKIITRKIRFVGESGNRILVGSIHDITERKQAEEKLRETNEYLQNLINYANAPIIVWDNEFKITRFNQAFEKLSGYPYMEVIGKRVDILFPRNKVESSLELINRTAFGTHWETVELEILRKDGVIRNVLWNSANIMDAIGNEIVATIAQGNDITERKKTEEEIQKQLEELRRWFEVTLDREGRVIELKQEVNELLKKVGEPMRYENTIPQNPEVDYLPTELE